MKDRNNISSWEKNFRKLSSNNLYSIFVFKFTVGVAFISSVMTLINIGSSIGELGLVWY